MKTVSTLLLLLAFAFNLQAQDSNPLPERQFEKLRKEVEEQSFDSKRLERAKEVSSAHYLYVSQINAIMQAFSLESNRLEYAKYAYATTLDAENYEKLMANFRMSASKEELKTFLSKREPPVVPGKTTAPVAENKTENTNSSTTTISSSSTTITKTATKTTGPIPMSDQDFSAAKQDVANEDYESKRLGRAKQVADANYMLCGQVKELMDELSFESSKLDFSKYAYEKTYDQANYEIVKGGLNHSKSKEELTAFLKDKPVADYTIEEVEIVLPVEETITEDNTTSSGAISSEDFANFKTQIASQSSDSKKMEKAKAVTGRTFMTTAQVKEIVDLFLFDESRLEYAKLAYPKTTDQSNFLTTIKASLEAESHKTLEDFVKNAPAVETGEVTEPTGPSELSNEDFEALLKKIHGQSLESHKLEKAKMVVDRSHVSAAQVKKIIAEFTLEETRLEYAKYAYSKTLDKDQYQVVRDALYKSASRYNLDRFIKEQNK